MYEKVIIEDCFFESSEVKSFLFKMRKECKPGQFFMVWLPTIGERPFSVSYIDQKYKGITVKGVGKFTKKLLTKKNDELLWIRGPYGKGFSLLRDFTVVAGGIGFAPFISLFQRADKILYGCKTKSEIPKVLMDYKEKLLIATEDGSSGKRGLITDFLDNIESKNVLCCGPEKMMWKVFEFCLENNFNAEFSLERYMKCGIGICGSCELSGLRVCKDGPVFSLDDLKNTDFGKFRRDKSGRKYEL